MATLDEVVLPAHAGMILKLGKRATPQTRAPRSRGDDPLTTP